MTEPSINEQTQPRPSATGSTLSPRLVTSGYSTARIVRGREALLAVAPMLAELAERWGQTGAADNVAYFLSLAASLRKTPCLVLIGTAGPSFPGTATLNAAVLLFEYRFFGRGIGVFAPEDTTGRRCVIAPPERRAAAAAAAVRALMADGAQFVYVAFQQDRRDPSTIDDLEIALAALGPAMLARGKFLWSVREVQEPSYLPLLPTYDQTLARIGRKTRYNLRYFRRRAERELGCTFVPKVEMTRDELFAFNRLCSYAVEESQIAWRYDILPSVSGGFLSGVRDRDGHWLALLCGRRTGNLVEVDWQMNRSDLPHHSLSVVIRSFLIEHAISGGCTRLYMEGGTNQSIQHSFVDASVTELTVTRRNLYAWLVRRLAPKVAPYWNRLAQIVGDPSVTWRLW